MLIPVFELNQDDDFVKVSLNFGIKKVVSCIGVKRQVLFLFNFFFIRIFLCPLACKESRVR